MGYWPAQVLDPLPVRCSEALAIAIRVGAPVDLVDVVAFAERVDERQEGAQPFEVARIVLFVVPDRVAADEGIGRP